MKILNHVLQAKEEFRALKKRLLIESELSHPVQSSHTSQSSNPTHFNRNKKIGLVPTMGALHDGHISLIQKCRSDNEICVLSIFVNPTQFNDPKDFEKYPITWETDLEIARNCGVDYVLHPVVQEMYPDDYRYKVTESKWSSLLCGKSRPGHFDGVLTVVMKLFQIVSPDRVYFGEKDFQQLQLIRDMIRNFFLEIELVPMPTIREASGLAMSSRNQRLHKPEEWDLASQIYKTIRNSSSSLEAKTQLEKLGFQVDYVEDIDDRRYVAVFLNSVRLIDNVQI